MVQLFIYFPNGEMVQWWIDFFGHIVKWWSYKKINGKINCMVLFNCFFGYQLGFGLLSFHPKYKYSDPDKYGAVHLCYL